MHSSVRYRGSTPSSRTAMCATDAVPRLRIWLWVLMKLQWSYFCRILGVGLHRESLWRINKHESTMSYPSFHIISFFSHQIYISTRRGSWVANRVSDYGMPIDLKGTRRFANFVKDVLGKNQRLWNGCISCMTICLKTCVCIALYKLLYVYLSCCCMHI